MTPPTIETPRLAASYCLRCENRIQEHWGDPTTPICATCALEAELFDREARLG